MDALRNSRSEWLVKKMPNGLDSKVGRLFEGGHDLSGGEWQRLALARIMYRNADIWILDEPTSSLDPEAEAGIFAELKENLRGRIGIVISHRFSTVRIADRIAVIDGGRVTEIGIARRAARGGRALLPAVRAAGRRLPLAQFGPFNLKSLNSRSVRRISSTIFICSSVASRLSVVARTESATAWRASSARFACLFARPPARLGGLARGSPAPGAPSRRRGAAARTRLSRPPSYACGGPTGLFMMELSLIAA